MTDHGTDVVIGYPDGCKPLASDDDDMTIKKRREEYREGSKSE
jgi:hypothetical protein